MKGDEIIAVKKKDKVCEPASSPEKLLGVRKLGHQFCTTKGFLEKSLKISGLLTSKFPSGLRSAPWVVWHPASANFPWDEWTVQGANLSPQGLIFAIWVIVAIGLLITVVWLSLVAIRLYAMTARVLR